ncbi:hypothetical protein LI328DRAFT_132238 [Trichoderma asperelloides]|nr:hypothetical protein LI328DRAFT_132238 [Trichoderma asperelloides]
MGRATILFSLSLSSLSLSLYPGLRTQCIQISFQIRKRDRENQNTHTPQSKRSINFFPEAGRIGDGPMREGEHTKRQILPTLKPDRRIENKLNAHVTGDRQPQGTERPSNPLPLACREFTCLLICGMFSAVLSFEIKSMLGWA